MHKRITAILFLALMATIAATASLAETITISAADVVYKVNQNGINGYNSTGYVNSPATSIDDGAGFRLKVTNPSYQDAGILMYFGGGLTLGDLQSLTVTSSGAPLSITLWLDTDGDGDFLNAAGGIIPDDHGLDSRFGNSWDFNGTLTSSTTLYRYEYFGTIYSGAKSSLLNITLGELKNLLNPNTPVAIWIGISNSNLPTGSKEREAHISSIEITKVPEPSLPLLLGIGFGAAGLISRRRKMGVRD